MEAIDINLAKFKSPSFIYFLTAFPSYNFGGLGGEMSYSMCYRKYGGGKYISGDRADSCKETTTTSCLSGKMKKKTAKQ